MPLALATGSPQLSPSGQEQSGASLHGFESWLCPVPSFVTLDKYLSVSQLPHL